MNVLQLGRVYVLPSVGMPVKRCAECMDSVLWVNDDDTYSMKIVSKF